MIYKKKTNYDCGNSDSLPACTKLPSMLGSRSMTISLHHVHNRMTIPRQRLLDATTINRVNWTTAKLADLFIIAGIIVWPYHSAGRAVCFGNVWDFLLLDWSVVLKNGLHHIIECTLCYPLIYKSRTWNFEQSTPFPMWNCFPWSPFHFPPILALPDDFTFTPAGIYRPGSPMTATYVVNADGVALEGKEAFNLEIVELQAIVNIAPPYEPVIIQTKVTVTIVDKDGRCFWCTAVRYDSYIITLPTVI